MYLCVNIQMWVWVKLPTKASREHLGAGITGSCETPYIGSGNQTLVLCKSSKTSYTSSHLSSPSLSVFKNKKENVFCYWSTQILIYVFIWKTVLNALFLHLKPWGSTFLLMSHVLLKVMRDITIGSILILALGIIYINVFRKVNPSFM